MVTDIHSFSHPNEAIVKHLHWEATIDFEKKSITATATWDIQNISNAPTIIFDTKLLTVESVRVDNEAVSFQFGEKDSVLGQSLNIPIEEKSRVVSITYSTSPDAEALQWLNPQQTAEKKHPFLFSQSQAILARSWVPCQDSPGVRFTYSADVKVPVDLLPLMSASNPQKKNDTGVYHF
jgi:aminopeptidase N